MDIQVALDRIPLDRAVQITEQVSGRADWVEVGTSLVKQYGLAGIRDVVAAAGRTPVLADLKTVDDVEFELSLAYDAGAGSVTVLGMAPAVTRAAAARISAERGRELVVDMMGMDAERIARVAAELPDEVVLGAHVGKDEQRAGARPAQLLGEWARGRRIALAGGLTADDLDGLRPLERLRVIVGSAVTKADDPVQAVDALRRAAGREPS